MFYGHYKSTTLGQTGCVKEFVTKPQDNAIFMPMAQYSCDLCNNTHGFRLMKVWQVNSPRQHKGFKDYCDKSSVEMEVSVG